MHCQWINNSLESFYESAVMPDYWNPVFLKKNGVLYFSNTKIQFLLDEFFKDFIQGK